MSSQDNKKPSSSSRQARPRTLSTLAQHLSNTRGLGADRVAKARPQSTSTPRLSEKQQQAILDAVVSSGAFDLPEPYSTTHLKVNAGNTLRDPNSLDLGTIQDLPPTPTSVGAAVSVEPASTGIIGTDQLDNKVLDFTCIDRHNMTAATYMLPSFGLMDHYNPHYQTGYQTGQSYISDQSHSIPRSSPPAATYGQSYTSSPALVRDSPSLSHQQPDTRQHRSSYAGSYHSASQSPYLAATSPAQGNYGFPSPAAQTSQFPSYTPTSHGQDAVSTGYASAYATSPHTSYGAAASDTTFQNVPTTSAGYVPSQMASAYLGTPSYVVPSSSELVTPTPEDGGVRILNSRPKPQCWDHGCNGRQFSTFSNLLRHQREKSGTATKSVCPRCGAEFTRTTARNGHMAHDKCKRKSSTSSTGAD